MKDIRQEDVFNIEPTVPMKQLWSSNSHIINCTGFASCLVLRTNEQYIILTHAVWLLKLIWRVYSPIPRVTTFLGLHKIVTTVQILSSADSYTTVGSQC